MSKDLKTSNSSGGDFEDYDTTGRDPPVFWNGALGLKNLQYRDQRNTQS
jgi:hypothetical protein